MFRSNMCFFTTIFQEFLIKRRFIPTLYPCEGKKQIHIFVGTLWRLLALKSLRPSMDSLKNKRAATGCAFTTPWCPPITANIKGAIPPCAVPSTSDGGILRRQSDHNSTGGVTTPAVNKLESQSWISMLECESVEHLGKKGAIAMQMSPEDLQIDVFAKSLKFRFSLKGGTPGLCRE